MDGEADRDHADVNAAEELLKHTVWKKKLKEVQKVCRRVNVAVLFSRMDVVDLALKSISAIVAGAPSCNDELQCFTKMSESQIEGKCLGVQRSNVTLGSGTWCLPAREWGDEAINLRASLDTSNEGFKLSKIQDAAVQKEKEAAGFERNARNARVGRLQVLLSLYRNPCNHAARGSMTTGCAWDRVVWKLQIQPKTR